MNRKDRRMAAKLARQGKPPIVMPRPRRRVCGCGELLSLCGYYRALAVRARMGDRVPVHAR